MISKLLLRNNIGLDRNACFVNSAINVLRRVQTFKDIVSALSNETTIHAKLHQIFSNENSNNLVSAYQLRREVDRLKNGRRFSSGNQQDCKEFLDALLEFMPSLTDLFNFSIKRSYFFINHNFSPACRYCHQVEDPVSSNNSTLHIHLLPTNVFRYA